MTYEPLHICTWLATRCLPSDAHRSCERCPSNSEADTHIIGLPLVSRYAAFDPSIGPNRPHISSVTSDFKERGRQNQPEASPIALTRPPACSRFSCLDVRASPPFPSAAAVSAASVKGYLRMAARDRKGFFAETCHFFRIGNFRIKTLWLGQQEPLKGRFGGTKVAQVTGPDRRIRPLSGATDRDSRPWTRVRLLTRQECGGDSGCCKPLHCWPVRVSKA